MLQRRAILFSFMHRRGFTRMSECRQLRRYTNAWAPRMRSSRLLSHLFQRISYLGKTSSFIFFLVTFSSDRSQCYKSMLEWYYRASLGVSLPSSSAQLLTQSLDKQSSDSGYLTLCILKSQSEVIHRIAFVLSETELM